MKPEALLFLLTTLNIVVYFSPLFFWLEPKEPKIQVPANAPPPERPTHMQTQKLRRCFFFPKRIAGGSRFVILNDPEGAVFPAKLQLSREIIQTGREQGADRVLYFQEKILIAPQQKN